MSTREGAVKIADFGLAQELRQASPDEPASGTLLYMAPERLAGAQGDERADLYALGALLYELFAGRPPFSGTKTTALIQSHLSARPAPLRSLRPEIPLWFEQLVLRLLEKEPAQRHWTATEVLQVLEEGEQHLRAERAGRPAGEHWPLVGREAKLALLQQALEDLKAGRDALILVEGEAGIGKTHLLEELARTETAAEVRWLWGQGQETMPYGAFAQVLREALGVGPGDSPAGNWGRKKDSPPSAAGCGTRELLTWKVFSRGNGCWSRLSRPLRPPGRWSRKSSGNGISAHRPGAGWRTAGIPAGSRWSLAPAGSGSTPPAAATT